MRSRHGSVSSTVFSADRAGTQESLATGREALYGSARTISDQLSTSSQRPVVARTPVAAASTDEAVPGSTLPPNLSGRHRPTAIVNGSSNAPRFSARVSCTRPINDDEQLRAFRIQRTMAVATKQTLGHGFIAKLVLANMGSQSILAIP